MPKGLNKLFYSLIPFKKRLKISAADIVYRSRRLVPHADKGIRVLVYHSITDKLIENDWDENTTPKDLFDRQMGYLADNKYNIISCRQVIQYLTDYGKIPPRAVALTFDDGYKDNYTNAFPILKEYNFCATIFPTINFLRDYSGQARYLSSLEIINMRKSGIIDFGSHGLAHKALTRIDEQQLNKEIEGAKQKLEEIINEKIDLLAYPFGHIGSYNKNIAEKAKAAGFAGAFTSIFGLNSLKTDAFSVRRNRISWLDNLREFEKLLAGAYDWYALCQRFGHKRYEV